MRHRKLFTALLTSLALVALGVGTAAATGAFSHHGGTSKREELQRAINDQHPKNVIFFLGDGMGTQEITAARYYQEMFTGLG